LHVFAQDMEITLVISVIINCCFCEHRTT
jgi:hypothetical protein